MGSEDLFHRRKARANADRLRRHNEAMNSSNPATDVDKLILALRELEMNK